MKENKLHRLALIMTAALVIMGESTILRLEAAEKCMTMAGADCLTMPLGRMIEYYSVLRGQSFHTIVCAWETDEDSIVIPFFDAYGHGPVCDISSLPSITFHFDDSQTAVSGLEPHSVVEITGCFPAYGETEYLFDIKNFHFVNCKITSVKMENAAADFTGDWTVPVEDIDPDILAEADRSEAEINRIMDEQKRGTNDLLNAIQKEYKERCTILQSDDFESVSQEYAGKPYAVSGYIHIVEIGKKALTICPLDLTTGGTCIYTFLQKCSKTGLYSGDLM